MINATAQMIVIPIDYRSSAHDLSKAGSLCNTKKEVLSRAKFAGLDKEQTSIMLAGFTFRSIAD